MEIFGSPDRTTGDKQSPIVSEYPAWYHREHVEELSEQVDRLERELGTPDKPGSIGIPPEEKASFMEELASKKEQLNRILNAKPKLMAKDKDKLYRVYRELGAQISDLMPTRTDMHKGLASPHDEVRKSLKEGCVDAKGHAGFLKDFGITPNKQGRITRNQASKVWKICGRLLETQSNVEHLRKDRVGQSWKPEKSLEEMYRECGVE